MKMLDYMSEIRLPDCFYRFRVIKGKPSGGAKIHTHTHTKVKGLASN